MFVPYQIWCGKLVRDAKVEVKYFKDTEREYLLKNEDKVLDTLTTSTIQAMAFWSDKLCAEDVFIDKVSRIKIEELIVLLDSKLIDPLNAAARFLALSLAVNPATTDEQIYDALVEYDGHPDLVSVVGQLGKSYVVETYNLLKNSDLDWALSEAAEKDKLEIMTLLKDLGASNYNFAFVRAAGADRIEAMRLLKKWGATVYDWALEEAAFRGRVKAMIVLCVWGAKDLEWALGTAASGGHLDAMELLATLGAKNFDLALAHAAGEGELNAMKLLKRWGAKNFNRAVLAAESGNRVEAVKLLKEWS